MRAIGDVRFGILGPLVARPAGGAAVSVGGPRPRALLALLLLDAGRLVSVERLIDGQYGDRPPAGAANAIQAQVSRLRRHLPGLIEFHGTGYRLAVEPDLVDAHRFERLSLEGRRLLAAGRFAAAAGPLRDALALWRGPAFADVADAPFAGPRAVRLEELRLAATEDLYEAELELPGGGPVGGLRELVAAHPLRERARGLLMRALHAAGRPAEALEVFDQTRRLLASELGTDPSPELAALHLEILRGERERTVRTGPPAQLTSFVGREEELDLLAAALSDARLVTIVGPGGTGKTRLAVEATGGRGACFVDLSLVEGPGRPGVAARGDGGQQVAQAVLGALGLREPALRPYGAGRPDPVERLVAALAGQETLLILDNCEHVIAEAATLARRLLAASPGLTVLATSREPLGITGEHLVPLAPLPLGGEGDPVGYPAIRLFAERAAAVRPGFALGPGNLETVSRICAALDGLPLAIELAAARVRTFGVAEIATRLAEHGRFSLLSRGDRTAAARHQTLRGVVEWSWSLLGPGEQALARRFAVFTGGAGLTAAERVCDADGPENSGEPGGVAGLLADLVDKSLVESDGERFHMLETIRLFCLERLVEAGEEERVRRAHAAWALELARQADDHLYGAGQLAWLGRLSADNANLRAALRWSVEHDRATAMRLVATLAMYRWLSGRRGQATRDAARLLELVGEQPPDELAEEYVLVVLHAVPEPGSPYWERARAIVEALDRPRRHRFGVALWGMIAGPPDRNESAERGMALLGDDPWSRALGRLSVALLALLNGAVPAAERELETVLADFGALGERWGKAQALDWLAQIAGWRGDWARAMGLWRRAVGLLEEVGALDELVDVLARRAGAHWRAGDGTAARADYERAGELERRLGRPELMAWVNLQLGEMARLEGDLAEAARRLDLARSAAESATFTAAGTRSQLYTALGRLATARGDLAGAGPLHAAALAAALGTPMSAYLAEVAEGLAGHTLHRALTQPGTLPPAQNAAPPEGPASSREAGPRPDDVPLAREGASSPPGTSLAGEDEGAPHADRGAPPLEGTQAAGEGGPGGLARRVAAEEAAVLLGAGVALRGVAVAGDRDVAAVAARATAVLGAEGFAVAYAKGAAMGRQEALTVLRAAVSR